MPAGTHGNAQATRPRELNRLDHIAVRRDRNDDVRKTIWNPLLPNHPAPSRFVLGVSAPDCSHFAVLVRVSVFLILPGFASFQGKFALEIRIAFNSFPIFPREFE